MNATVKRVLLLAALPWVAGCHESTSPGDVSAPAAPRGVYSITGDEEVHLRWLGNTERDVAGYAIYEGPCARGNGCPYERVGTTSGTEFIVRNLSNGDTRFFAVAAYDHSGNESPLSYEDIHDTPRPEGFDLVLGDAATQPASSGYDFSAFRIRPFDDPLVDVYFGFRSGVPTLFAPFTDTQIQDAGYAGSLDAVDFAPSGGWSPSGTVEVIDGHCYVVWTPGNHFAKLRVTALGPDRVTLDWAYQVASGNRELSARRDEKPRRVRRSGAVQP
jgi:hypothetical protein